MRRSARPKLTVLPLLCLATTTLVGCILEDPRASAVVLLDREALEAGPRLEQNGQAQPATTVPLLVVPEAPVDLHTDSSSQTFSVRPGELVYVRGAELALSRYALGQDADADRVELVTTREVVDEFAAQMSAEVNEVGPEHFELRVSNAFAHLAQMSPADVLEVLPVLQEGTLAQPLEALRGLDGTADAPVSTRGLEAGLDPVGIYHCGEGQIVLDADGRLSGCLLGQPMRGHYSLEQDVITFESSSGPNTFELSEDGVLTSQLGVRCRVATR